jgi:Flp pilus assembly protein TadD
VQSFSGAVKQFVADDFSGLDQRDAERLNELLQDDRSPDALIVLLQSNDPDVAKTAAVCLGSIGQMRDARAVSQLLRCEGPLRVSLAEHALWAIWFRQAGLEAARTLHVAAEYAAKEHFTQSSDLLNGLIERYPTFAEAHHQLGMVRYLSDDYYQAVTDFERAVELNPLHFSAMSNLGHCCVQLGRYDEAQEWYLTALEVHPRLPGIRQMLRRLRDFVEPWRRSSE